MGRDEVISGEDANINPHRSMQEYGMSYSSVASQLVGKNQGLMYLVEILPRRGEVSFKQWVFKVKSVMKSHTEGTLSEGIVHSLQGAMADLV